MVENVIETFDLTKIYKLKSRKKEFKALNNVNISVKEGEIFGLLGPNGAGKTTLIQILTTIIQPTSGYAIINGYNILKNSRKAQDRMALMLGSKMIYYRITAYDNLKYFCKIYNVPDFKQKIYDMAENFGLKNWLGEYVENFSSGMKMKLALCRTFLLERNILFLDEPTAGVDVETVSFIVDKIRDTEHTIFLTSHNMNVVEKLCNRVAFLNKGDIVKIGNKEEIKKFEQSEINIEIEINNEKKKLLSSLNRNNLFTQITETSKGLIVSLKDRFDYKELLIILSNYEVLMVKELDLSLEDLFLKIMKKDQT